MTLDGNRLLGRTYGPGEFTIDRWIAHLWADATRNDRDAFRRPNLDEDQFAPPQLAQLVAREGAGTGNIEAELREDAWETTSVVLGGQRLSFERALRVGQTYRASAEVSSVEEKEGTSGQFQVLTIAYDVETAAGEPAYELESDLILRDDR